MTEREWDDWKDREIEEQLVSLFDSLERPQPAPGFTARTMTVVRRQVLPVNRRALRRSSLSRLSWVALVTGLAAVAVMFAVSALNVSTVVGLSVTGAIRATLWLIDWTSGARDLFATLADAVARAVATPAVAATLAAAAMLAAASLAMLHRVIGIERQG